MESFKLNGNKFRMRFRLKEKFSRFFKGKLLTNKVSISPERGLANN